ncbi:mucin-3A-like [Homalodisca vitripennis]|uniref:mucin-3A-like n=1 Tax=Homalodisca vitripennis TaxID=197043 RepID=UPI001EEAF30D|nr:mucin-3A-like [Homalodisca vitripennis]
MKQRYQVQPQSETPQQEDASFRVCLCTMLVILALFGLTSFFLWLSIDPQRGPDKGSGDNTAAGSSYMHGHVKQDPTTTKADPSLDTEKVQTHIIHNKKVVTNHPSTGQVIESSTTTTSVSNTKISAETKQAQTITSHSPSEVTTEAPIVTIINKTPTFKSTTVEETESSTGYYSNNPVTWNSEGIYVDDNVTEETNESSTTSYTNDPVIFNSNQSYFNNTSPVESTETTSYYSGNPVAWNPGSPYFENTTSVSESNLKVTTESSTESFSQLNLTGISQKTEDSSVISSTITTTEVQYIQNNSSIDKINKLVTEFEVKTFSTTENDVDENIMKSKRLPFETTTEEVSSTVTPGSISNTVTNESNITELTSTHSTITNSSVDDTAANESDITESTSTHSTSTESSVEKAETVTEETATSALSKNLTENTDYEEYTPQDSSTSSEAVSMRETSTAQTPGSTSNTVTNESNITELTSTHSTITNSSVDDTAANESDITESTSTHSTSTESSVEKAETVTEETATSALSKNLTENTDYEEYTSQDSSTSSEAVFMRETSTARTCCIPAAPACPVCPTLQNPTTTTVTETTPATVDKVCETKECYATAGRMLSLVDVTVDPCKDFYSYACGGILDNPTVLEEDPEIDVWDRIKKAVKAISPLSPASHQKLKNYYEGCVHYDKLISEEERKIEGRNILDDLALFLNATSDIENNFTQLLINLFKLLLIFLNVT